VERLGAPWIDLEHRLVTSLGQGHAPCPMVLQASFQKLVEAGFKRRFLTHGIQSVASCWTVEMLCWFLVMISGGKLTYA
jgi:hypothetical protein